MAIAYFVIKISEAWGFLGTFDESFLFEGGVIARQGKHIDAVYGREVISLPARSRRLKVNAALEYWRSEGFPYPILTPLELSLDFQRLLQSPIHGGGVDPCVGSSTTGLRFVNHFHPQMWHARSHGHLKSPFDYFQIDEHLRNMLERAPRFWPDGKCWSAQAVRNLVRIYAGGRVGNFRPVVARVVIARFTKPQDVVVDFSSGYGGRFLACVSLSRSYFGIDPAMQQIEGLIAMKSQLAKWVNVHAELNHGCSEEVLQSLPSCYANLVFSSPPFYNLEIYSDEPTQSASRYPTYQLWVDSFLRVIIGESRRVLRRSGYFAIHTPSRNNHRLGRDACDIAGRYFRYIGTIDVEMAARPLQRSINPLAIRIEPIQVFQKR